MYACDLRHAAPRRTCCRAVSQSFEFMFFICAMAACIMPGFMPCMPRIMLCIWSGVMRFICARGWFRWGEV